MTTYISLPLHKTNHTREGKTNKGQQIKTRSVSYHTSFFGTANRRSPRLCYTRYRPTISQNSSYAKPQATFLNFLYCTEMGLTRKRAPRLRIRRMRPESLSIAALRRSNLRLYIFNVKRSLEHFLGVTIDTLFGAIRSGNSSLNIGYCLYHTPRKFVGMHSEDRSCRWCQATIGPSGRIDRMRGSGSATCENVVTCISAS